MASSNTYSSVISREMHDRQSNVTEYGSLVSKETVVLRRWESETIIWFYQTS